MSAAPASIPPRIAPLGLHGHLYVRLSDLRGPVDLQPERKPIPVQGDWGVDFGSELSGTLEQHPVALPEMKPGGGMGKTQVDPGLHVGVLPGGWGRSRWRGRRAGEPDHWRREEGTEQKQDQEFREGGAAHQGEGVWEGAGPRARRMVRTF